MKLLILLVSLPSVFLFPVSSVLAYPILVAQETETIENNEVEATTETEEAPSPDTEAVESAPETPSEDKYQGLTDIEWYNKGLDFIDARDYQSAIDAFTKASELNDQDADTFYNLGYVRVIIGEKRKWKKTPHTLICNFKVRVIHGDG